MTFTQDNFVHYKTGIGEIDDDHWEMLSLQNSIVAALVAQQSELAVELFDEMIPLMEEHQAEEERIMEEAGFPYTEYHKRAHHEQIEEMIRYRDTHHRNVTPSQGFIQDLQNHLTHHIDSCDLQFSDWLRKQPVSKAA